MNNNPGKGGKLMVGVDSTLARPKISPPKDLTKEAKKNWKKIIDATPNEQFTISDYPILGAYCEAYAMMIKSNQMLAEQGEVLIDEASGRSYANPWTTILSQSQSRINAMVTKLRLSPASRKDAKRTNEKPTPSIPSTKLGNMIKR